MKKKGPFVCKRCVPEKYRFGWNSVFEFTDITGRKHVHHTDGRKFIR